MKIAHIAWAFPIALFSLASCDDTTSNLGLEVMPDGDFTSSRQENYPVELGSMKADSILARTTTAYLGKFTDPVTGTVFESDFLTQFYCPEDFEFPAKDKLKDPNNPEAKAVELQFFYSSYFGDSLATHTMSIYELNKVLTPDKLYYTSLDATDYYDATQKPLNTQAYTAVDMVNGDSLFYSNGYHLLTVKLPKSFGDRLVQQYYTNPEWYKNSEQFINNVFKGFYIKNQQGDGSVLNINYLHLNVYFEYYTKTYDGKKDSLATAFTQFVATPEVVQENRFRTENLEPLLNDEDNAYIQTPSGIFPVLTLPIDDVAMNDTINSAILTIKRKNNDSDSQYKLGTPSTLLLVKLNDLKSFFEEQKLPDNVTSYITSLSGNSYTYSNIGNLINKMRREKRDNPTTYNKTEGWNKVVLVPVTQVTQTINNTSYTVRILHDLSLNFAKLKKDDINLRVIYSKYNEGK